MMTEPLITWERATDVLDYDSETGIFVWRVGARKGKRAGSLDKDSRYRRINVDGRPYYEHRLAWLIETGRWPQQIDHATGDRTWNTMQNLRAATHSQNQRNRRGWSKKSHGCPKGVYRATTGKFYAQIWQGGRNLHLGTFATPQLASAAYAAAARSAYGDFAHA